MADSPILDAMMSHPLPLPFDPQAGDSLILAANLLSGEDVYLSVTVKGTDSPLRVTACDWVRSSDDAWPVRLECACDESTFTIPHRAIVSARLMWW